MPVGEQIYRECLPGENTGILKGYFVDNRLREYIKHARLSRSISEISSLALDPLSDKLFN